MRTLSIDFTFNEPTADSPDTKVRLGDIVAIQDGIEINGLLVFPGEVRIPVREGEHTVGDVVKRVAARIRYEMQKAIVETLINIK